MSKSKTKYLISLSGEYGVCSELAKRGVLSNITFGNLKSTDIIISSIEDSKIYTIEVKTSITGRFVTGFFQKYFDKDKKGPDFWVLTYMDKSLQSRFFVLSHQEMADAQMQRNGLNEWRKVVGVDNVLMKHVQDFENKWDKIINLCKINKY
jgi:hypothetical protein